MTRNPIKCILLICILQLAEAEADKEIIFKKISCPSHNVMISNVECYLESNSSLAIDVTTGNNGVNSLVGISRLHLFIYGKHNVMRLNGLRLDICKMLSSRQKTSILTFLYKGISQTENNLPKQCPFKRNTTYKLHKMMFDANYLPNYLPEYNFTFSGHFYSNNINLFDVNVNGSFCQINHDCSGFKRKTS